MAEAEPEAEGIASADGVGRRSLLISEAEVAALSDDHTHCLVCYSDLTVRGKTPCQHDDICGVCHLRLRHLHGDKKCPICKATNEAIIVDSDAKKRFSDYPMWGDEIGAGFLHRQDVGMFFETDYYGTEILPLFGHSCHECDFPTTTGGENEAAASGNKKLGPLRLLQDHLRTKHRLTVCQLCVDHKRDFVSRLPRLTPSKLQNHLRHGDGPTSGFSGHPICEFCKPKRFYDLAFLHQHLHKDHYKCHVCEKRGEDNQFFKNYKSMERHFDQQHFMCHDVQCLAARFVVFENELDLRGHELSVHGGTSTGSTKINLEFRTRRAGYDGSGVEERQDMPSDSDFDYGLDGQAFMPPALPSNQNNSGSGNSDNVQLHPLHLQRTAELQAQAAAIRQQYAVHTQEESFPSLQSSVGASSAPLVGWTAGTSMQTRLNRPKSQAGKVTEEHFPSLSSASSAQANANKKAIKGNVGATRRQFAAMTTSASASQPSYGAAAGTVAPAYASNFLSPPSSVASINRQVDLAPDNFPALGRSSNARTQYTTANALGRQNLQPRSYAPSITSDVEFPSMGGKPAAKRAPQPAQARPAPSLNSAADFPAPPSSSAHNQYSVRQNVMGGSKQPSQQALSNVLPANLSSAAAKVTLEEMKASLGPDRFKQLKRLTKNFSDSQISPEGYVDQTAALFDKGYGDSDFWSFVPSLLESCPNQDGSDRALNYMTSLKRQQYNAQYQAVSRQQPAFAAPAPPAAASWGGNNSRNVMRPPPANTATATAARPLTQPMIGRVNNVVSSKKKNSWGGGGAPTVVRAKAAPGSVSAAVATQGPQGGSATKFMAKQQKQQNYIANQQPKTTGKKKKKEKDELRALAFGK
jgi:hypothetical protein